MSTIKSPLSDEARKVTGEALQGALIDLVDLALVAKQAHWNVIGKRFRPLHLQLDEVVALAREGMDQVAERAITIGVNPDGTAQTVARDTKLPELNRGYLQDDKVVATIVDSLGGTVERMRGRIEATEEPDPLTQDLLIDISRGLEMQYWMFQAQA